MKRAILLSCLLIPGLAHADRAPVKSFVDPAQGARCSYDHFPTYYPSGEPGAPPMVLYETRVSEKIDCLGMTDACKDGGDECRCVDERRTDPRLDVVEGGFSGLKTILELGLCVAGVVETGGLALGACFAILGIEGTLGGMELWEVYKTSVDGCDDPGDPGNEIGPIPLRGARARLKHWEVNDELRSVGMSADCRCTVDVGWGEEVVYEASRADTHTFSPLDLRRDTARECGEYLDARVSSVVNGWCSSKEAQCKATCESYGADSSGTNFFCTHGEDRGLEDTRTTEFYELVSYTANVELWTCPSTAQTCSSPATVARDAVCPGASACGDVLPQDGFDDCTGALIGPGSPPANPPGDDDSPPGDDYNPPGDDAPPADDPYNPPDDDWYDPPADDVTLDPSGPAGDVA